MLVGAIANLLSVVIEKGGEILKTGQIFFPSSKQAKKPVQ